MIKWQIIALTAGVALLAFLLKRSFGRGKKQSRYPYQKNNVVFTPDDRAFFLALREAVGAEFEIFGKIRVCDIIVPKKGASSHAVVNKFSPIEGRHFDFVLCEKNRLTVVCAVGLHDKTRPARRDEDDSLMPMCENVGLPFLQFSVKANYAVEEIREKLHKAIIKEPILLVESDGRKEPRISSIEDMKF